MPKRIRVKVDTTFVETGLAGKGARYLKSEGITVRDGIQLAIGCLFGPLGAVIDGASRTEVEQIGERSRAQLETYINLALNRCQESETVSSPVPNHQENEKRAAEFQRLETIESVTSSEMELDSVAARVLAQDDDENDIDLENEVL